MRNWDFLNSRPLPPSAGRNDRLGAVSLPSGVRQQSGLPSGAGAWWPGNPRPQPPLCSGGRVAWRHGLGLILRHGGVRHLFTEVVQTDSRKPEPFRAVGGGDLGTLCRIPAAVAPCPMDGVGRRGARRVRVVAQVDRAQDGLPEVLHVAERPIGPLVPPGILHCYSRSSLCRAALFASRSRRRASRWILAMTGAKRFGHLKVGAWVGS